MIKKIRDNVLHTIVYEELVSTQNPLDQPDEDIQSGWVIRGVVSADSTGERRYTLVMHNVLDSEDVDPDIFLHLTHDKYGEQTENILEALKNMLETMESTQCEVYKPTNRSKK